ncbi:MAG: GTP-binding protein [Rhodospirillales bacterium]|nr:GTP-binding protein [Rhodospirillales bacterium]
MTESIVQEEPLPVTVLTGFLGSGKTTLLSRLVADPRAGELAIIVNELGEIGLDHQLIRQVDESTLLLDGGCLCCTVRDDLVTGLRDLAAKRAEGTVSAFKRVVIETTGLADPAPIVHTLIRDPMVSFFFRLDGLIATLDAINAARLLENHQEALKQAAMADRLLVTKTDLVQAQALKVLERQARILNPAAPLHRVQRGRIDPALLFNAGLYNAETKTMEVRRWLAAEAYRDVGSDPAYHHHRHHHEHDHHHRDDHAPHHPDLRHDSGIEAFCLTREQPVVWDRLADWIETMILTHGEKLLRVKGIVNAEGESQPIALHGVQHLFHPPAMLEAWPDLDRRTRLVVIARDLNPEELDRSLSSFLGR